LIEAWFAATFLLLMTISLALAYILLFWPPAFTPDIRCAFYLSPFELSLYVFDLEFFPLSFVNFDCAI